ncbi:(2Fe-2S)-binding protein [Nitrospina watsonii]|uniref:BFD domain protein (2Fe-2S)-binding domain protein (Modular protein) n=1 Tax=Nitrospina watsonii TaxID=1323948 RepID=A0ABM9HHQ7_9BACT|nr:(2Fe-2S)-binding protein [Nitrospina watsonii]CAI2719703.1 BFD domain protein (2Fe-2S)-binding domain protein (Modular protein) [Nitrospina watsonii]
MTQKTEIDWVDHFKKVCICRSITGGTIMKAIQDGALSFEALRRAIRVGTGNCKAKRCRPKIEDKLHAYRCALEVEAKRSKGEDAASPPEPGTCDGGDACNP